MSGTVVGGAVAVGLGATLLMDLWNLFLKRVFGVPSLDYCLLGRWVRHMSSGRFRHVSIASAPAKRFECASGYLAHYSIGVVLALAFVAAARGWLDRPTLLPAVLYGVGTVVFPFFLLQPALGLGVASSNAAHPARARLKSLGTHLVFGIGMYVCAVLLRAAFG